MLVVVVDTATPAVTAALVRVDAGARAADGVELLAGECVVDGRAHGERLAPALSAVLARTGVAMKDLDALVAGLGPGPFTGLRVGLVTAASLGQALGIPTYGVCSLDGIGAATAGVALVATDARRREVYWARYRDGRRTGGPGVDRPDQLDLAGVQALAGVGAPLLGLSLPTVGPAYPDPVELARQAWPRLAAGAPGETLTPLYLRRPDAVEPGPRKLVRQ